MAIWAKSDGKTTLKIHTNDVLQCVKNLKEKTRDRYPKEWWQALYYAAFLHDIGKIDPDFQQNKKERISHNLLSLFLIDIDKFSKVEYNEEILSAVMFHHWRDYYPSLLAGTRAEKLKEKVKKILEDINYWEDRLNDEIINELSELAKKFDLQLDLLKVNKKMLQYLSINNLNDTGLVIPPYTFAFLPFNIANSHPEKEHLRIFLAGNLMRCDHFASMVEVENPDVPFEHIEIDIYPSFSLVIDYFEEKFKKAWQVEFFKNNKKSQGENLILVSPTGTGKTVFAYLWGATERKNIYLLPLRSAVNALWQRTRKDFSEILPEVEDYISLLHSDSALVMNKGNQSEENESEMKKALSLARSLSNPYLVATADQIAPAALKYPGFERIYSVLMNSMLIIDEVQAYDPKACAIITHLIEQNARLGGKTLLITATLPPFVKEKLKETVFKDENIINVIEDNIIPEIGEIKRHRICFKNMSEDLLTKEMLEKANQGKKILAIFNTVNKAVEFFNNFDKKVNIPILLLHSRFTLEDRNLKEKLIEEMLPNSYLQEGGCIVIATQVVEASLDLDADILYTEAAPIDSLIQRMGRCFRRYSLKTPTEEPQETNVNILIDEKQISSGVKQGKNAVYYEELVYVTLCKLAKAEENLIKGYFDKGKKNDKKRKESIGKLMKNLFKLKSFILSELDKQNLVEAVYKCIEEYGSYINEYYDYLEVLRSGYCTERKRDAERIFREVNNVEVIAEVIEKENYKSKFKELIKEWFNKEKRDYFSFYDTVLSKIVVSTGFFAFYDKEKIDLVLEIENEDWYNQLEKDIKEKIKRWCKGIIVVKEGKYSYEKGLELIKEKI